MKYTSIIFLILFSSLLMADDITLKLGGYVPSAKSDIWDANELETNFKKSDMVGFYIAGEADLFLGHLFNISFELGYYRDDALAEDVDFVWEDGSPIIHTIYLRIIPLEGSLKLLPLGRNRKIIPYVGAGIGIYFWDYQEFGDFVINRYTDPQIITALFQSTGQDLGTHFMFGLMFPFGYHYTFNAEIKYIKLNGKLGRDFDPSFEPIDLGGVQATIGFSYWF